jgi:hypothetical protein
MNAPATQIPETFELIVRPGAVMSRAMGSPSGWLGVLAGFAGPLAAAGAFSAFSYAGTVTAGHFLANLCAYFLPFAVQALGASIIGKVATGRPLRQILQAFALTYLPLELFFLFLLGVMVIAPEPYGALLGLVRNYVLPGLFGIALVWGAALTYVAFRTLAEGRRWRAVACTALQYVFFLGVVAAYIFGMKLLPLPMGG